MSIDSSAQPESAFAALAQLVRTWRGLGRKTTTAGLKPALQEEVPGFAEEALGFTSFRDFVAAAAQAGHVATQRLENGHTLVLLPGETPQDVGYVSAEDHEHSSGAAPLRLRSDLWNTLLEWDETVQRLWDRNARRAFYFPVDADRRPLWLSGDARFVEVPGIEKSVQISWMAEWSALRPRAESERLLGALSPDAPLGQFRRELEALGLTPAWRDELQRRASAHAERWARDNGINLEDLLDRRRSRAASARPSSISAPTAAADLETSPSPTSRRASETGDAALLRELLHRAIDRMTLAEMLALPIRAEHLLDR